MRVLCAVCCLLSGFALLSPTYDTSRAVGWAERREAQRRGVARGSWRLLGDWVPPGAAVRYCIGVPSLGWMLVLCAFGLLLSGFALLSPTYNSVRADQWRFRFFNVR